MSINKLTMNNRRVITWLIAGTLVLGIAIAVAHTRDSSVRRYSRIEFGELAGAIGKLTFVQRTALPAAPSEVRIYKVQPLVSKKDALLKIFKALSIESSPEADARLRRLERAPGSWAQKGEPSSASIGGWLVEVWSDGKFIIHNTDLLNRPYDSEKAPVVPTAEEARKVADDFFARVGPLPTDVTFAKVQPGEWDTFGAGDKPDDTVVRSQLVSYSAAIDGIPVYASVNVYVGPGPAVISAISFLCQVVPDDKVPILSPQEAFEKLRAGEGFIDDGPSWDATANVTLIRLVHYPVDIAPGRSCSHTMPIYVFRGEAVADGRKGVPWRAFVEAVRPEFLKTKHVDQ